MILIFLQQLKSCLKVVGKQLGGPYLSEYFLNIIGKYQILVSLQDTNIVGKKSYDR